MQTSEAEAYARLRAGLGERQRWDELAGRVAALEERLEAALDMDGPDERDVRELVRFSRLMRGQLGRVQDQAGALLDQIAADPQLDYMEEGTVAGTSTAPADEVLEIQREMHRPSHSLLEVIKAVFLWRDNPDERADQQAGNSQRL